VAAALDERAFSLSLWSDGVEQATGRTGELADVAEALSRWISDERPSSETIADRFPFLEPTLLGRISEQGEAIEHLWRNLLESPPNESMRPLIERAAAEPQLRRLRPWTSFDRLCFSRRVGGGPSNAFPTQPPATGSFVSGAAATVTSAKSRS
jgi:hypothetical protein